MQREEALASDLPAHEVNRVFRLADSDLVGTDPPNSPKGLYVLFEPRVGS